MSLTQGIGNLQRTHWVQHGCAECDLELGKRRATVEEFIQDALGNRPLSTLYDTLTGGYQAPRSDTMRYDTLTGRLTSLSPSERPRITYHYDAAGNQVFSEALDAGRQSSERASFFAADGSLRMVDSRAAQVSSPYSTYWQQYAVEDYRYDALGRRVWVRARKWCWDYQLDRLASAECRSGLIRRTVWDGDHELAEIQMPWALQGANQSIAKYDTTQYPSLWENDTAPLRLGLLSTASGSPADPNPLFGHVVYSGLNAIDQPVAITRMNYVSAMDWYYQSSGYPPETYAAFTIVPFWDARGDAPQGVVNSVVGDGLLTVCNPPDQHHKCVGLMWPWDKTSNERQRNLQRGSWHGTLLESKRDKSGFGYMRNRQYDPLSGRFTQEDPIGLAGGLNVYGFAAGDAINYSDPFGLRPCGEEGYRDHSDFDGVTFLAGQPIVSVRPETFSVMILR